MNLTQLSDEELRAYEEVLVERAQEKFDAIRVKYVEGHLTLEQANLAVTPIHTELGLGLSQIHVEQERRRQIVYAPFCYARRFNSWNP